MEIVFINNNISLITGIEALRENSAWIITRRTKEYNTPSEDNQWQQIKQSSFS